MESPWGTLFHSSHAWGLGFKTADQLYFKFEKVHIVFNLNISLNWHLGAQTYSCKKKKEATSLVVQWLRLPVQGA